MKKCLVVGAGMSGSVAARILAEAGWKVTVIDKRPHIGGAAFDERETNGITVQRYGPHIFHTNSKKVWDFLCRFTNWRLYQHRVLSFVDGMLVPIPINIDTVNMLYGFSFNTDTIKSFYASRAEEITEPTNYREAMISRVGTHLYELMFENYTRKQWGLEPTELPPTLAGRVAARNNRDSRYFTDRYQGIPKHGYAALFTNMLDHPDITVRINCAYTDLSAAERNVTTVYTGPIDEYFGYMFGRLPYRSMQFVFTSVDQEWYQPAAVVNYPNDYDFTRITEFKHWTNEISPRTSLLFEFPTDDGEPLYPVPTDSASKIYRKYAAESTKIQTVKFIGRLGGYRYLNMDQAALEAMHAVGEMIAGSLSKYTGICETP